jgi:hypothetical protein
MFIPVRNDIGAFFTRGLGDLAAMYVLIVSDAPTLPVDLCITSAMLGHAAGAVRPGEFGVIAEPRPALVLLDLITPADIPASVAAVRERFRDVAIAILTGEQERNRVPDGQYFRLAKPVTTEGLRTVMQLAQLAA